MNKKELESLGAEDFLYLPEKRWKSFKNEIFTTVEKLNNLSAEYEKCSDLASLEDLKRVFNANLNYLSTLYAITKTYKGTNHTYLETALKQLKASTMEIMLSQSSKNITATKEMYCIHPNYTEKLEKINRLMKFFIEIEIKYERFEGTLQCIIQSISVAKGDFNHSKAE